MNMKRTRSDHSKSARVAIIDYEMSNLFSVERACNIAGMMPIVTKDGTEIVGADAVILPGVGAYGTAMSNLSRLDLVSPIIDFISAGKPFMGICLGMQLLMTESEEFGIHKGLNIIQGHVSKLPSYSEFGKKYKVPHVGWNRIKCPQANNADSFSGTPLKGICDGEFMYFVHSYYVIPQYKDNVLTTTNYSVPYASGIISNNVFGFQFHPEKSGHHGLRIYQNFKELIEDGSQA